MIKVVGLADRANYVPKFSRQSLEKNSPAKVSQSTGYAKIPAGFYRLSFKGSYNPVNSKRTYTDYGSKLYEGPITEKERLSDERQKKTGRWYKDKANGKRADFSGKDLSNYSFRKGVFYKANMQDATFQNTDFQNANLWGINCRNAKIKNTNFTYTNLSDADFTDADFADGVIMTGANIIGADFSNTSAKNVGFRNAIYNSTTVLPKDITKEQLDKMILFEPDADLSNMKKGLEFVKMRYVPIVRINFENTSLKRVDLRGAWVKDSNLRNVDLTRAYAREIDIADSDFTRAKMKQINLDNAKLNNVNMQGADLRGAILTWKEAKNVNLKGVRYDQFTIFNPGFNPKENGMIEEHSNPGTYGEKYPEDFPGFEDVY